MYGVGRYMACGYLLMGIIVELAFVFGILGVQKARGLKLFRSSKCNGLFYDDVMVSVAIGMS